MQTLSIGKLRGLQQCTSRHGTFTCLALDHRQNLRRALQPTDPTAVSDADLRAGQTENTPQGVILDRIDQVLGDYAGAGEG